MLLHVNLHLAHLEITPTRYERASVWNRNMWSWVTAMAELRDTRLDCRTVRSWMQFDWGRLFVARLA
jgi:hypothetical protein